MNAKCQEIIKDNLKAYTKHFQPITIETGSDGKSFYVYQNGDSTTTAYIQYCENIHYLNGWLYGAVQAHCGQIKVKEFKTTQDYFCLSLDELLDVVDERTREERELLADGKEVCFFDDEKKFNEEKKAFEQYVSLKELKVKAKLKTINERIAFVLA